VPVSIDQWLIKGDFTKKKEGKIKRHVGAAKKRRKSEVFNESLDQRGRYLPCPSLSLSLFVLNSSHRLPQKKSIIDVLLVHLRGVFT
jgi:hypothetical protein